MSIRSYLRAAFGVVVSIGLTLAFSLGAYAIGLEIYDRVSPYTQVIMDASMAVMGVVSVVAFATGGPAAVGAVTLAVHRRREQRER